MEAETDEDEEVPESTESEDVVRFDVGNADQFCDAPHQVGLSDPGWTEQNDVLFLEIPVDELRFINALANVVIMVADCDGEHFFRL